MVIVYTATRNYYKYLGATIKSLFAHNPNVKVYVLAEDDDCCGMTQNPAIVHYAGIPNWFSNPYIPRAEYLAKYL